MNIEYDSNGDFRNNHLEHKWQTFCVFSGMAELFVGILMIDKFQVPKWKLVLGSRFIYLFILIRAKPNGNFKPRRQASCFFVRLFCESTHDVKQISCRKVKLNLWADVKKKNFFKSGGFETACFKQNGRPSVSFGVSKYQPDVSTARSRRKLRRRCPWPRGRRTTAWHSAPASNIPLHANINTF